MPVSNRVQSSRHPSCVRSERSQVNMLRGSLKYINIVIISRRQLARHFLAPDLQVSGFW